MCLLKTFSQSSTWSRNLYTLAQVVWVVLVVQHLRLLQYKPMVCHSSTTVHLLFLIWHLQIPDLLDKKSNITPIPLKPEDKMSEGACLALVQLTEEEYPNGEAPVIHEYMWLEWRDKLCTVYSTSHFYNHLLFKLLMKTLYFNFFYKMCFRTYIPYSFLWELLGEKLRPASTGVRNYYLHLSIQLMHLDQKKILTRLHWKWHCKSL